MQKYRKVKVIGKGSFGNAVLVSLANDRKKQYVMKVKYTILALQFKF